MASKPFREYVPGEAHYAPRKKSDEWDEHQDLITTLFNNGTSKRIIREHLGRKGFQVTQAQLTKKMTNWNLRARGRHIVQQLGGNATPPIPDLMSSNNTLTGDMPNLEPLALADRSNQEVEPIERTPDVDKCCYDQQNPNDIVLAELSCQLCDQRCAGIVREGGFHSGVIVTHNDGAIPVSVHSHASTPYASASNCHVAHQPMLTVSTDVAEDPMSSALSRIAQCELARYKLEAVQASGMSLPTGRCCCEDFIDARGLFKKTPDLYSMLLKEARSNRTLKYAIAVVGMLEGQRHSLRKPITIINTKDDHELMATCMKACLGSLQKQNVRNDAAYLTARRIATLYSRWDKDNSCYEPNYIQEARITATLSSLKTHKELYKGVQHFSFLASTGPKVYDRSNKTSDFYRCFEFTSRNSSASFYAVLRHCLEALKARVSQWGEDDIFRLWCSAVQGDVLATMNHISRTFSMKRPSMVLGPLMDDLDHVAVLLSGIGLMIAQKLHAMPVVQNYVSQSDFALHFTSVLDAFEFDWYRERDWRASSSLMSEGTYETPLDSLLQACWVCHPEQPLFGPSGLHLGPCRAKNLWDILDKEIKDFDKPATVSSFPWARQQNAKESTKTTSSISANNSADDISILSSSTSSSFRRVLNAAYHLCLNGSQYSLDSMVSKWSGHMSVDSWNFDKLLLGGKRAGPTTQQKVEYKKQDNEAYGEIQRDFDEAQAEALRSETVADRESVGMAF